MDVGQLKNDKCSFAGQFIRKDERLRPPLFLIGVTSHNSSKPELSPIMNISNGIDICDFSTN